ncbi:MAG: hypothetical protein WA051_03030 [Minisyncoccia bacterium]
MIVVSYGHTKGEIRKILDNKKLFKLNDEIHSIDPTNWSDESVSELTQTQGLFAEREIFFVDHVLSELEPEEITKEIKNLCESVNLIVFIEDAPNKQLEKIEKSAEHVLNAPQKTVEKGFNVFSLTDALFAKDKKKLWLLYQQALSEKMDPEFDIYRILFWGVKMLALAKEYGSAASAGISPFVYSKAKGGVSKYKDGEIEKTAQDLANMTIQARQGEEWEVLIERFVLSI